MNRMSPEWMLVDFIDEIIVNGMFASMGNQVEVDLHGGGIAVKAQALEHVVSLGQHMRNLRHFDIRGSDDAQLRIPIVRVAFRGDLGRPACHQWPVPTPKNAQSKPLSS